MRFDNPLTRMLGVKYPIIQGAFGTKGSGTSSIAVPVSEAGGLGILTTISYADPDEFQEDVRKAKAATDKPFAVNFTLFKDTKYDNAYHEEYVKIALKEGVRIVFTSAYDGSIIGRRCQKEGCRWIHKCATLEHAVSIARKGADAVVIVGLEGTGFKSPIQNTTLINMTVGRRLIDVPVIAAGGIGDARGFLAALAMGAAGVYIGTAFMATQEFRISEAMKKMIVNQDILDADYRRKIYQMKHGGAPSLASGLIDSIPTAKEFIEGLVGGAEQILKEFESWGMIR